MLAKLLDSDHELIQRQSAKALANLGVNSENKRKIAEEGAIPKLVRLAGVPQVSVKIEAIAALANLAVNGKIFIRFIYTLETLPKKKYIYVVITLL